MDNTFIKELYHFGIPGQKHGRRRYQNEDGSLTEEGRERYLKDDSSKPSKKSQINDIKNYELHQFAETHPEAAKKAHNFLKSMGNRAVIYSSITNSNKLNRLADKLYSDSAYIKPREPKKPSKTKLGRLADRIFD